MTYLGLLVLFVASATAQSGSKADWLREHNAVRTRAHVPSLVWSDTLAASAERWANTLLRSGRLRHDPDHTHGQNIFAITTGSASIHFVVQGWAEEASSYDYRSNSCRDLCGHYTQLVWRNTREVGCGVARSASTEIWVCNYSPPGNVVGQRPY